MMPIAVWRNDGQSSRVTQTARLTVTVWTLHCHGVQIGHSETLDTVTGLDRLEALIRTTANIFHMPATQFELTPVKDRAILVMKV